MNHDCNKTILNINTNWGTFLLLSAIWEGIKNHVMIIHRFCLLLAVAWVLN